MSKKKKVIVLSVMIALLAATAVFNFVLSGKSDYVDSTSTAYFMQYRTQRSQSRNEQILQLDRIIAESDEQSSAKEAALTQKMQLTSLTEQELRYETLIKAYGFEEVVVTMNVDSPNVNVVVKSSDFSQSDAVKIYNLLSENNTLDAENVNIIPYV